MLDADHVNGDRSNSKKGNLQVLCVWCHALKTRKVQYHEWAPSLTGKIAASHAVDGGFDSPGVH